MSMTILPPGYRWYWSRPNMTLGERLMETAYLPVHDWEDHVFRRVSDNVWRCECNLERFDVCEQP